MASTNPAHIKITVLIRKTPRFEFMNFPIKQVLNGMGCLFKATRFQLVRKVCIPSYVNAPHSKEGFLDDVVGNTAEDQNDRKDKECKIKYQ
jgi:hypothetical protein